MTMSNVVAYSTKSDSYSKIGLTGTPLPTAVASKILKYQHIAPAPAAGVGDIKTRKYTPRTTNAPYSVDQTQSVQRRNARERNRVKQVNNSFARLRQHIPQTIIADLTKGGGRGPHKKVSKVDTLRIAVEYIRRLQDLVDDLNGGGGGDGGDGCNYGDNSNSASVSDTASNSSYSSGTTRTVCSTPPPPSQHYTHYTQAASPPVTFAGYHQSHGQPHSAQAHFPTALLTPTSLGSYSPPPPPPQTQQHTDVVSGAEGIVDGCHSPTTSFNSSISFDSGTFEANAQPLSPAHISQAVGHTVATGSGAHLDAHLQLKFEPYENFNLHEEDCTPDEEEILDYIALWQEQ